MPRRQRSPAPPLFTCHFILQHVQKHLGCSFVLHESGYSTAPIHKPQPLPLSQPCFGGARYEQLQALFGSGVGLQRRVPRAKGAASSDLISFALAEQSDIGDSAAFSGANFHSAAPYAEDPHHALALLAICSALNGPLRDLPTVMQSCSDAQRGGPPR
jgi:hypothetical protein